MQLSTNMLLANKGCWIRWILQETSNQVIHHPTSRRHATAAIAQQRHGSQLSAQLRIIPTARTNRTEIAPIMSMDACQNFQVRNFAAGGGGSRGSRGHGWYVNYRAGDKGGRHLRGEYFDREGLSHCTEWNESILKMGSTRVYIDIVMEPRDNNTPVGRHRNRTDLETLVGEKYRLTIDLASTVMPETTKNFLDLCEKDFVGSKLYRIEKNVGLFGGDVLTNTGRSGKAAYPNSTDIDLPGLRLDVHDDPLVMWHIPGTISMIVPKVGCIDSRFMMCTNIAPHIDGIHRAFGQLSPESFKVVQDWTSTLMTYKGVPTSFSLLIVECGIISVNNVANIVEEKQEGSTIAA